MKTLLALALVIASLAPAAAQTKDSFTGKWEGTFTLARPDGTEVKPSPIIFNITQKDKEITGTAGPADQQQPIVNGVADGTKATFDVQMPQGPPFKFSLSLVKGRLQGDMTRESSDGTVRKAKVDAAKAAADKK
ncbi:MAG TPA: hypothetical protein VFS23_23355 [Vicinamibacterales bacterium]|nr:hypothetical protein [Vicinamibacterales bacterium]